MSNYLVELTVIHVILMLGYWLFLRKERQYAKLRFYLIGVTLLALSIPLLKLPKLLFSPQELMDAVPMEALQIQTMPLTPTADLPSWNNDLLIWTYIAVSMFLLFKFLTSVGYLIYLERMSSFEKFNDLNIRKVRDIKGSFTFFNWIFLSEEIDETHQDYGVILKHEKAHVWLGHSYDLVFFELFKVFFWWLPTAWFINKEIRKIHEYQADSHALKSYHVDRYSSILISTTLKSNGLSLASSFHDGLILKRLIAMKQQAKKVSHWKIGSLLVLCVVLIIVFACSEELDQATNNSQGDVFTAVEQLPEYAGGMEAFYQFVGKEIKYPLQARQKGIEGTVYVQFDVEKDGSLSNVTAVKGIGAGCDREAVRVVQNALSFTPGSQRGKPVRVRLEMPIIFKLKQDQPNPDSTPVGMIILEEVESKLNKFKVEARYTHGEWSGTVYDEEESEGLPGANIVVVGTNTGTVSNIDGTFKVKSDKSKDLLVSFVGYESVRLKGK